MMQFYPSESLRERILAFCAEHRELHRAQLVWAAIAETRGQLEPYLRGDDEPEESAEAEEGIEFASDDVFAAFPITPVNGASHDTARQMGVRLHPRQIAAIDDLVSASPTARRSAYVCAALTAYLDAQQQ